MTSDADEAALRQAVSTVPVSPGQSDIRGGPVKPKASRAPVTWEFMRAAWSSADAGDGRVATDAEWAQRRREFDQQQAKTLSDQRARVEAIKRRTAAREADPRFQDEREAMREALRAKYPAVRRHDEAMRARREKQ